MAAIVITNEKQLKKKRGRKKKRVSLKTSSSPANLYYSNEQLDELQREDPPYIHYQHEPDLTRITKRNNSSNIVRMYIAKLDSSLKRGQGISKGDEANFQAFAQFDSDTLIAIFDAIAEDFNKIVQDTFNDQITAIGKGGRKLDEAISKNTGVDSLQDILNPIGEALNTLGKKQDLNWDAYTAVLSQYIQGQASASNLNAIEGTIINNKSFAEHKDMLQRVLTELRTLNPDILKKGNESALRTKLRQNIYSKTIGEYVGAYEVQLYHDGMNYCDEQLMEGLKTQRGSHSRARVLQTGSQSLNNQSGNRKTDVSYMNGNLIVTITDEKTQQKFTYKIKMDINFSVKWYDELLKSFKTRRDIGAQSSFANIRIGSYIDKYYKNEKYNIYNSIAWNRRSKIAAENVRVFNSDLTDILLLQALAGKESGDIQSFIMVNGRLIPIIKILSQYMEDSQNPEKIRSISFNEQYNYYQAYYNEWVSGPPSHELGYERSKNLIKKINSSAPSIKLDRNSIYELAKKYSPKFAKP